MRDLPTENQIRESVRDCNTWHRRFFRCWIDGSYLGEDHYRHNCEQIKRAFDDDKMLRAFAISWFCDFLAHEEDCSRQTVQRHLVREVQPYVLEALNMELIDDMRDLVRDDMEAA